MVQVFPVFTFWCLLILVCPSDSCVPCGPFLGFLPFFWIHACPLPHTIISPPFCTSTCIHLHPETPDQHTYIDTFILYSPEVVKYVHLPTEKINNSLLYQNTGAWTGVPCEFYLSVYSSIVATHDVRSVGRFSVLLRPLVASSTLTDGPKVEIRYTPVWQLSAVENASIFLTADNGASTASSKVSHFQSGVATPLHKTRVWRTHIPFHFTEGVWLRQTSFSPQQTPVLVLQRTILTLTQCRLLNGSSYGFF